MHVHGIHHVTAITAEVAINHRFYTDTLGLRLVKKSVNQDDVSAYHMFYADADATPGSDITFFDWPNAGYTAPGSALATMVTFRVNKAESLTYWQERLEADHCVVEQSVDPMGRDGIQFSDPEGLQLEIVVDDRTPYAHAAWAKSVPAEHNLRGMLGVSLNSARPASTIRVLTEILGFQQAEQGVFQVYDNDSFGEVRVLEPTRSIGRAGAGGIHHVAFRVSDDEALYAFKDKIEAAGLQTSGYVDRFYFHSLYFREPGGILFELATDGPGMASDEEPEHLGEKLALPPFLESRRAEIEAGLKPIG